MEQITSRQNPLVKRFRELASHGASNGDVLLDGEHLLNEALASGVPVEVALVSNRLATASFIVRASKSGTRTVAVSDQVLAAVSPVHTPSGVVAIAHKESATLDDAARVAPQLMLVLNGVQ